MMLALPLQKLLDISLVALALVSVACGHNHWALLWTAALLLDLVVTW